MTVFQPATHSRRPSIPFAGMLLALMGSLTAATSQGELLYVTLGNNRVVTYDLSPDGAALIESSVQTFIAPTYANLPTPYGIALDGTGNVCVANRFGDFVSKFDSPGAYLSRITVDSNAGPSGLAFDSAGKLFVTNSYYGEDGLRSITKYNTSGTLTRTITGNLAVPFRIAIDASNNIQFANTYSDFLFTPPPAASKVSKFTSGGVFDSYINAVENLGIPAAITISSGGNLYVSDDATDQISIFSAAGEYQSSFGSDDLADPIGVTFDATGSFYVANNADSTSSKFNSSGVLQFEWSTASTGSAPYGIAVAPVPDPGTLALAAVAGVAGLAAARRRRRKHQA